MVEQRPNFQQCCRLCLSEPQTPLKSIFDEDSDDRALQQKILASVAVEISIDDKLTTRICESCVEKINDMQTYKQSCVENQLKLEQWLQNSISSEAIQIKEEPADEPTETVIDPDITIPEVVMNGTSSVKNEPPEVDYNDSPPPLTPQNHDDDVEIIVNSFTNEEKTPDKSDTPNPTLCKICSKTFSSVGNLKRHIKVIHDRTSSDIGSISQDDISQSSIDSQGQSTDSETRKIQFAAGLRLLQTNSVLPITHESLSKIEVSYIDKCKAMSGMYRTLICACHGVQHPNLKGLLSHLRALRIWFPVFTCYHCMITFTDRSSATRHHLKCGRNGLETLIKLSNLRKRSEVKTRLYQNYKCTRCKFMYSFHEDFCKHVDEDHSQIRLPKHCSCGRLFTNLEDYKDHAYISCMVEYYCDICFITVKTLEAFRKHAAEEHDKSEGFVLTQNDNYRKRKPVDVRDSLDKGLDSSSIISGKRKRETTFHKYGEFESTKVLNPLSSPKLPGTACPICYREYSNNANMNRHYKIHLEEQQKPKRFHDESLYCCPDCGGMFSSDEWDKHKEKHRKKSCDECGKVFQFQAELEQHRSVHLNLKVYRDSKTQAYKSTMLSPKENSTIMMMCEICDTMFNSKEKLKEHKLIHEQMPILEASASDSRKFSCKLCDKHYAGYGGLWDHNKKKHPDNKTPTSKDFPKQCMDCDKVFTTGGSYFMHRQMHERIEQNSQAIRSQLRARSEEARTEVKAEEEDDDDIDDDESYHTCKRCFKVFSSRCNLRAHMRCHGIITTGKTTKKAKKVWCDICHSAFDSPQKLERHKSSEHNTESEDTMASLGEEESDLKMPFVFTCDVCVQTFTTKQALRKHKEKHAQELNQRETKKHLVYCKYCKISFESTQSLNNHMLEEHSETKFMKAAKPRETKYFCDVCKKCFGSPNALTAHQGWHKRGKPFNIKTETVKEEPIQQFKCRTCSAILPNDTSLQLHILEKHRNVNATVVPARCTMCSMDSTSTEEYEKHKKFHDKPGQAQGKGKAFSCSLCSTSFSKLETLNVHIREFHTKPEYRCTHCDRVFDKHNSLSIHLKVHEKQTTNLPVRSSAYSCSICKMGFDVPKDLRKHTIEAHPF